MAMAMDQAQAQASYVAGFPYPSRSPRAHPSGWTRTQGLSHRDSHAPPLFWDDPPSALLVSYPLAAVAAHKLALS